MLKLHFATAFDFVDGCVVGAINYSIIHEKGSYEFTREQDVAAWVKHLLPGARHCRQLQLQREHERHVRLR